MSNDPLLQYIEWRTFSFPSQMMILTYPLFLILLSIFNSGLRFLNSLPTSPILSWISSFPVVLLLNLYKSHLLSFPSCSHSLQRIQLVYEWFPPRVQCFFQIDSSNFAWFPQCLSKAPTPSSTPWPTILWFPQFQQKSSVFPLHTTPGLQSTLEIAFKVVLISGIL